MATRKRLTRPHYHGCVRCHCRYEDTCEEAATNKLCVVCRGGRTCQIIKDNAAPHDCCRIWARIPTKEERKSYRLAGDALWFICGDCKRTHPFDDPKKQQKEIK